MLKAILFIIIIFIHIFENMATGEDGGGPSQRKNKRPLETIELSSDSNSPNTDGEENTGGMNPAAIRPDTHFKSLTNAIKRFDKHQEGIKIGGEGGQQANPSKKHKSSDPKIIHFRPPKHIQVNDPINSEHIVQQFIGKNADIDDFPSPTGLTPIHVVQPIEYKNVVHRLTGISADVEDKKLGRSEPFPPKPEDKFVIHQPQSQPIQHNPSAANPVMMAQNVEQSQQQHSSSAAGNQKIIDNIARTWQRLLEQRKHRVEPQHLGQLGMVQGTPSLGKKLSGKKLSGQVVHTRPLSSPQKTKGSAYMETGMNAPVNDNQQIVHHQNPLEIQNPQPQNDANALHHYLQEIEKNLLHSPAAKGQGSSSASAGLHHYLQEIKQNLGLHSPPGIVQQGSSSSSAGVHGHHQLPQSVADPNPNKQILAAASSAHQNNVEFDRVSNEINAAIGEIDQELRKLIEEDRNLELQFKTISYNLGQHELKIVKMSDDEVQQMEAHKIKLNQRRMSLAYKIAQLRSQKERFLKQLQGNMPK